MENNHQPFDMSQLLSASTDEENDLIEDPNYSIQETNGIDYDEEEIEQQVEIQAEEESHSVSERKPRLDRLRNAANISNVAKEIWLKTQKEYWQALRVTINEEDPFYEFTYWSSLTGINIMTEIQSRHEQWLAEVEEIRAAKFEEELAISKAEKDALTEERLALKEERAAIKEERAALAQEKEDLKLFKSELKQDFAVIKIEMIKDLTKIIVTLASSLDKQTQKLQDQVSGAAERISQKFEEEISTIFDGHTSKYRKSMTTNTKSKSLLEMLIGKRNGD